MKVIDAGASTINIPDTVGYNLPHQFGDLISGLLIMFQIQIALSSQYIVTMILD